MIRFARTAKFTLASFAIFIALVGLQSFALAKLPLQNRHIVASKLRAFTHRQYADLLSGRAATQPSSKDTDHEGLTDWTEVNRTKTSYQKSDTDGEGLTDWTEVYQTKTNPRKADTDGDRVKDSVEVAAGSNPLNRKSVPQAPAPAPVTPQPPPPPADTAPPTTMISAGPSGVTAATSASFSFLSSESGSTFACRLDGTSWASCGSPTAYSGLAAGSHTFSVRATDAAGNVDPTPPSRSWTVEAPIPPPDNGEAAHAVWTPPAAAQVAVPVTLDGTASSGEGPLNCTWSFENQDGNAIYQTLAGCKINFTFSEAGTKYVKLSVEDVEGDTDASKQSFVVGSTADTTPPDTKLTSTPASTTTTTSASFGFSSTESGSSFECKLDAGSFSSCASPKAYSGLAVGSHTFSVRATDASGNVDASPASYGWTVQSPEPPPPPPTGSGCASGSTNATSASAVTSAVSAGKNVCVTANVGDVNFINMGKKAVVVSTEGGSMDQIEIQGTTDLTVRSARFTSVTLRGAHRTTIEGSTIGGTPANRTYDQLIFMPDESNDVTIKDNDIGWTKADNSGNTGYGCRCYGTLNRLKFVGNRIHDVAADGFQGVGGSDVLIDRNEIGPVGANSDSNEHSDNIQITGNGSNLRITNNWIHHQGYFEGKVTGNAGSTYIHGGEANSLTYENNLVEIARGRTEICGLGTGGTSRSNITIRRNTWVEGGQAFTGFPGFEWDCDSGSGNVVERNIAVDPDGGFAQDGSTGAATFSSNLWGQLSLVTLDSQGNCTSANCNPSGQEAIGYRKPSGVRW